MVTSGPDFSLWIDHTTAWLCTRDHKHRKVRATPVLLLCRLLTYRFLSNGRLQKRRVFHPLPRLCNWSFRPTRLEVPRQAFLPSFPVFHTQQVDVRSFAFDFGRLLVIDRRNSFGRLRRMCFNGYALSKQPKRGIELEPILSGWSSLARAFTASAVHCLARGQRSETSPRKGTTTYARSHSWKGRKLFKAHPTMLAFAKCREPQRKRRRSGLLSPCNLSLRE